MVAKKSVKFRRHRIDLGQSFALFAAGDANSRSSGRKLLATGFDAILCLEGNLKWAVFQEEVEQKNGEFFFIPPGTCYELRGGAESSVIVHLRFVEKDQSQSLQFTKGFKLGIYSLECELLSSIFINVSREIIDATELKEDKVKDSLVTQTKTLYSTLKEYVRYSHSCIVEKKVSAKTTSSELIGKVYAAVLENPEISVEEISDSIGVSASYLARTFKEVSGVTPKQYLNIYKINRSLEDLTKDKVDLSDLSVAMGFTDQSHFTNVFKRFLMTTPGELKKNSKSS